MTHGLRLRPTRRLHVRRAHLLLGMTLSVHLWCKTCADGVTCLVLCIVVCVRTTESWSLLSPAPAPVFLASFRGPFVIRVFCAQAWDTYKMPQSSYSHTQTSGLTLPHALVLCVKLSFTGHTAAGHLRTAPGWQPLPVPRWGRGTGQEASSVLWVSFCYTMERINVLHLGRL